MIQRVIHKFHTLFNNPLNSLLTPKAPFDKA